MNLEELAAGLRDRRDRAEAEMLTGKIAAGREYAEAGRLLVKVENVLELQRQVREAEELLSDPDFRAAAAEEIKALRERMPAAEAELREALIPPDPDDDKNVILEIRAGTGGDEAALFVGDLFRMYDRLATNKGYRLEVLGTNPADMGGYKEISAGIVGEGVFAAFKFEAGTHRVQRVPLTEASGRIHTSAATVAVLPDAEETDVDIRDDDLRIDVFRASGAGGQHVNKTESAVRITHLPTGTVVVQQDEKSQHKNKARAMKILRARIYDAERARLDAERAADRRAQVGSGDRSERIRTYNFPQGRVTDHRINLTVHDLPDVLSGGASLEKLIQALRDADRAAKNAESNG